MDLGWSCYSYILTLGGAIALCVGTASVCAIFLCRVYTPSFILHHSSLLPCTPAHSGLLVLVKLNKHVPSVPTMSDIGKLIPC